MIFLNGIFFLPVGFIIRTQHITLTTYETCSSTVPATGQSPGQTVAVTSYVFGGVESYCRLWMARGGWSPSAPCYLGLSM